MLKKFSNPMSPFAMYFKEAPGDPGDSVTVSVAPRRNRGTDYADDNTTVTVGPRANRGDDYAADPEPAEDTTPDTPDTGTDTAPADDGPPPDAPDLGDDEGTDYTADGDAEDAPDTADTPPDEGGDAGAPADNAGGEGGDEGADGDAPDGPDTGDGDEGATDYTDDGEAGGDEGGDTGAGRDTGEGGMTEEEKKEAEKKFYMYERFMHLYNILEVFIEKCRNIVKPDATQNAVIKTVANNFSDLYDNLYDYMTIKYKSASYVQILLYFETVISVIQLNFELLKNNKINLKQ